MLRARVLPGLFLLCACGSKPPVEASVRVEASQPDARPSRVTTSPSPAPLDPAVPIDWLDDREAAVERAVREGKKVLVFVVASWQPQTQHLDRTLWSDDDVRRAAAEVVAVRVDASNPANETLEHWLTERGIDHVPAVGLLHPDGSVIGHLTGPEVDKPSVLRLLR